MQQVDKKNEFYFQLSSRSLVHHSHINNFCQSHKQFSCPLGDLPCYRSFSKRGIPQEWQMRRRRKRRHEKGFLLAFPNTERKKMLFYCLCSLTPLPVDRQEWTSAVTYCREMTRDEWRSSLRDKSFPSLSFSVLLSVPPSLPVFLAAYDDVSKLLSRYTPPSFTHQP